MADVVVTGAGIVGASVAYHLARRGVSVTVVDRTPTPAGGASGTSFGWIGDTGGEWPGGAEDLRGAVRTDYRRLAGEVPDVQVRWTGSLRMGESLPDRDELARLPLGQHVIGRSEIVALEPHLHDPPDRAVYTPSDGGVDATRVTQALVRAAQVQGAELVFGADSRLVKGDTGRVTGVQAGEAFYPAAIVVVAAGADTGLLCAPLGLSLPVDVSPAWRLQASAPPGLVRTIVDIGACEVRDVGDGRLLLTAPYPAGASPADLDRLAPRTLAHVHALFGDSRLRLVEHALGRRPMPRHGPIVGSLTQDRSVYVAVMHAAVTLAPTVGRLVADELITGTEADELRRCRPDRFSRDT